ncbi:MAG: PadR family transcriptional regulator [Candidatus Kerfeldbacteria bacterium]|nr:PadR family transcriptional regulator [Candidatus Kerfeldbacteria bacterium]
MGLNREILKGHSQLIILAALARRPMHGYALSEHLRQRMPESFRFGVGMIYPLLHRMEKDKLIRGRWQRILGADRKVYALTHRGQRMLAAKKHDWRLFSSLVSRMIHQPT